MRHCLLILSILAILTCTTSAAHAFFNPANFWCKGFGSTGFETGSSVAVDASGNIFVTGNFTGTVSFGGASLVSAGGSDIFLAKYSPNGAHLWSLRFGGTGNDAGVAVALDASGSIYLTGSFVGPMNFGGATLNSVGGIDAFLVKLVFNGGHAWSKGFGSGLNEVGNSVAVDASGNVIFTGGFSFTVDFGGGNRTSAGSRDIFLAKYNTTGVHQWSQRFGGIQDDFGNGVAVDGSGNVFTTGQFQDTANFGGSNLVSAGLLDVYMAKFNTSGVHQWSQRYGDTQNDVGRSVAVNTPGTAVALTGYFQGVVSFGGSGIGGGGSSDLVVARYNGSGVHLWSRGLGGTDSDRGESVAIDASGHVVVGGDYWGSAYFGGQVFNSKGGADIFIGKYDVNGTHVWSGSFGGLQSDELFSVATDASGNPVVTGYFDSVADFGGTELVSAGVQDMFLAKYGAIAGDPFPFIISVDDIGNDQGRKVKLRFLRSGGDDAGAWMNPVKRYIVLRRDDAPPAMTTAAPDAMLDTGWTEVGSVSAFAAPSYGIDVPTIGDSTITLGQYYSVFRVRAATDKPSVYFTSEPDSGWSVDNLAPGVPQNFVYATGELDWDESNAGDFDYFTVYGADTDNFGAATVVNYTVSPVMDVSGSPYIYYFVTATDFSGNEGKPAKVNTLSGVGGTPKSYVFSVSNYPNPFNPRTTVRYTVPARGAVNVSIYDTNGARIATLVNHQERAAGAYTIEWDGRADDGTSVSSGAYFARIEQNGLTRSKKMMLLK
jgi:FlgD Ig-like domain/Beta-propeller repeat